MQITAPSLPDAAGKGVSVQPACKGSQQSFPGLKTSLARWGRRPRQDMQPTASVERWDKQKQTKDAFMLEEAHGQPGTRTAHGPLKL